jgi:hypothetical protein
MVQALLPIDGFTLPYEISYRGLKLPRFSAAPGLGYLRRGADLPQGAVGCDLAGAGGPRAMQEIG